MLIKALRNGLGLIIVFCDKVSRPKKTIRTADEQKEIQEFLSGHALYQFFACPFCVKTRRAIHRLNLDIELRDINKNRQHRQDLEAGGGRVKVPCLRIERNGKSEWMYESSDIIQYLEHCATTPTN